MARRRPDAAHQTGTPSSAPEGRHEARDSQPVNFGSGSSPAYQPPPAAPPPIPTPSDPAVTAASAAERSAAARARGRGATVVTGGMGLTTPAAITAPRLTGSRVLTGQ